MQNRTEAQDYAGATFILATKHAKSLAIAPPFWTNLRSSILEFVVDTDQLGTFSGEVERSGNALDCARRKCEWGLTLLGERIEYCLASEGSFGPHPAIPFLARDQEILYFIDRKRGFHLHMVHSSEKTNYQMRAVSSFEELKEFAESAQFSSHALVLRPNVHLQKEFLFKGIDDNNRLEDLFKRTRAASSDGRVWVQTDMRAQFNPSRMAVIGQLADRLSKRLATICPSCETPGWGIVASKQGLQCEHCDQPTEMIALEIYGCVLCSHKELRPRSDGLISAPQMCCSLCNP